MSPARRSTFSRVRRAKGSAMILDGGAAAAKTVTGNTHTDKIQNARDASDKGLGRGGGCRGTSSPESATGGK
jgi:hypothetical protein